MSQIEKPRARSSFRLWCGRLYFTAMRYALWHFAELRFARKAKNSAQNKAKNRAKNTAKNKAFEREEDHLVFSHQTPLLRQLKDVDMQYQYNKIVNLRLAAARLDGVVLRPGEVFSYWRLIGRPTRRKGYLDGIVLFCGTFRPGTGGGLCQLSNLIFWMTLHTPLSVVERYRHSYDVFPDAGRTQPFGSGATCVYPYRDLMIRNDTQTTFRLRLWLDDEFLHGEWLADAAPENTYRVVEKEHRFEHEFWGAYSRHNKLYREVCDLQGSVLREEFITENHALMMYSPLLPEKEARVNFSTK